MVIFRDIHRNDESHSHDLATAVFVLSKQMKFESTISIFRRSSRTGRKDESYKGRKINFPNSKTLVGWLVGVATDCDASYL